MVGDALVRMVQTLIPLQGRVCDYGAGRGNLIRCLIDMTRVTVHAVEFSPESEEEIRRQFASEPRFGGSSLVRDGVSEHADGFFDAVFLCETVEHLSDRHMDGTFREIARILRPGGWVVVTTPCREDMQSGMALCPDCGCWFHKVQHLQSFTPERLEQTIRPYGFAKVFCRGLNLWEWKRYSWRGRIRIALLKALRGWDTPNLVYLGRRE
ncbi:MAG: class I SAM-dependent methyltransferase [Kiritimatiellia bacterium]